MEKLGISNTTYYVYNAKTSLGMYFHLVTKKQGTRTYTHTNIDMMTIVT